MKIHIVILTTICVYTVSGCATITRGSKDFFEIDSAPVGVSVAQSNGLNCVTPCAIELPRKYPFTATFSLEGFKPLTAEVVPKQATAGTAGMAGNIIFGGLIGVVADSTTGEMKDLYPNPLIVKLAPVDSSTLSAVVLPEGDENEDTGESDGEEHPEEDGTAISSDAAVSKNR